MDMEVQMDFSEPLVDLSYMAIEGLELDQEIDPVRALVLSGNPISDYQFVEKFTQLLLLHCDNVQLKDISEFAVILKLPKLQVLILRGNDLELVDTLPEVPDLQHLDLCCNPFLKIRALNLPNLQKFYFGVPSPLPEYETQKTCYSRSKINSLKAFQDLFLSKYHEDDIFYARPNRALLGNIVFRLDAQNKRVYCKIQKTDKDAKISNGEVVIKLYEILQGCEIVETKQQTFKLSELAKLTAPLAAERTFGAPEYFYPTQHQNEAQLEQELAMLRAVQLKRGKNYCIVQIDFDGKCGIFLLTRDFEFLNYAEELDIVERIVSVANGVSVRITKGGSGRKQNFDYKQLEKQGQPDFLPMARHGLEVELEAQNGMDDESYEESEDDDKQVGNLYTPAALRSVITSAEQLENTQRKQAKPSYMPAGPQQPSYQQQYPIQQPMYPAQPPQQVMPYQQPYMQMPQQQPIYHTPPVQQQQYGYLPQAPQQQQMPSSFRQPSQELESVSLETQSMNSSVPPVSQSGKQNQAAIVSSQRQISQQSQFVNTGIQFEGELTVGNKINITPPHHIQQIIYYKTVAQRAELLGLLQDTLRQQRLFKEYMDIDKLFNITIQQFNMQPYSVIESQGQCYIVLNIQLDSGQRVPFKIDLIKLKVTNATQQLDLTVEHQNCYLIAAVKYPNRYATYFAPKIVEYIPQIVMVQMKQRAEGIVPIVIEQVPGKKKPDVSTYDNIKFVFYRNSQPIDETFEPLLHLEKFKNYPDGFYSCIAYICDAYENVIYEVGSDEIYLKAGLK